MNGNDFVKLMLESPLYVLMGNTMLITLSGRKTGRKISLPVNYYQDLDALWVLTSRSRTWWRNLRHRAKVHVRLHGKNMVGIAEAILDETVVASQIGEYVRHLPISGRTLGVRIQNGVANCEDTTRLAKERLVVKICL